MNLCLPTPIGIPGELYISGVGLAKGYLNLPHKTNEAFVKNPFASKGKRKKNSYSRFSESGSR